MAFFNTKEIRTAPRPVPPIPPYVPPVPPEPPTPESGSDPAIPRPEFTGGTVIAFKISTDELEKIDKSFTNEFSVTGVFKEDVDILRPIITIESNVDLTVYNYFTMNNRTYHITSCELLTGGLYRINAAVDVLTTYSTGIKSLEIIADKVQQKTFSTQDINDESHINASGLKRELKNFDIVEGNAFTEYPNLILITIGGETT